MELEKSDLKRQEEITDYIEIIRPDIEEGIKRAEERREKNKKAQQKDISTEGK